MDVEWLSAVTVAHHVWMEWEAETTRTSVFKVILFYQLTVSANALMATLLLSGDSESEGSLTLVLCDSFFF